MNPSWPFPLYTQWLHSLLCKRELSTEGPASDFWPHWSSGRKQDLGHKRTKNIYLDVPSLHFILSNWVYKGENNLVIFWTTRTSNNKLLTRQNKPAFHLLQFCLDNVNSHTIYSGLWLNKYKKKRSNILSLSEFTVQEETELSPKPFAQVCAAFMFSSQ